jgi:hypothetical protein
MCEGIAPRVLNLCTQWKCMACFTLALFAAENKIAISVGYLVMKLVFST